MIYSRNTQQSVIGCQWSVGEVTSPAKRGVAMRGLNGSMIYWIHLDLKIFVLVNMTFSSSRNLKSPKRKWNSIRFHTTSVWVLGFAMFIFTNRLLKLGIFCIIEKFSVFYRSTHRCQFKKQLLRRLGRTVKKQVDLIHTHPQCWQKTAANPRIQWNPTSCEKRWTLRRPENPRNLINQRPLAIQTTYIALHTLKKQIDFH